MKLDESKVVRSVRKHLSDKGWIPIGGVKKKGEQGPDIELIKPIGFQKRYLTIDAKGEIKNPQNRSMAFRTLLGQIVSRMERIDSGTPYLHVYGIALPAKYQSQLEGIAKRMTDMWSVMRLKVYLVHRNGRVEERNWKDFLRE